MNGRPLRPFQATKEYKMLAGAITEAAQKERLHLCTADRSTAPHTLTCTRKPGKGRDDDDDDDD